MVELQKVMNRDEYFPRFVTDDISKLPRTAPEEANWMTVMERMMKLEDEVRNTKSSVEANRIELLQQKDAITDCANSIKGVASGASYSTKAQNSNQGRGPRPQTPRQHQRHTSSSAVTPGGGRQRQQGPPQTFVPPMPVQSFQQIHAEQMLEDDSARQQQGQRKEKRDGKKFRPAIVGTKQDPTGRITGGPMAMDIKIWNVTPSVEPDLIRDTITAEGVEVKGDVVVLSQPTWKTKSFKVCIPTKDKEKILSPDVWPTGVKLGLFYPARKPRNAQNTNGS